MTVTVTMMTLTIFRATTGLSSKAGNWGVSGMIVILLHWNRLYYHDDEQIDDGDTDNGDDGDDDDGVHDDDDDNDDSLALDSSML